MYLQLNYCNGNINEYQVKLIYEEPSQILLEAIHILKTICAGSTCHLSVCYLTRILQYTFSKTAPGSLWQVRRCVAGICTKLTLLQILVHLTLYGPCIIL